MEAFLHLIIYCGKNVSLLNMYIVVLKRGGAQEICKRRVKENTMEGIGRGVEWRDASCHSGLHEEDVLGRELRE